MKCPCRPAESTYATCCGRIHTGEAPAPTALALMRSRYTAFVLGLEEYLISSWHSTTRPASVELSDDQQWIGLTIVDVAAGGMLDHEGVVEFVASYESGGDHREIRERSRFVREENRWVYLDGSGESPSR